MGIPGAVLSVKPTSAAAKTGWEQHEISLLLCGKAGAVLTSTEAVLFDLLGAAGTPEFKELAPLIK